jgi:hypothetical protein
MADTNIDPDEVGIRAVLDGVHFPAPRWQLVAHAQHWGANPSFITELVSLPVRDYRSLNDVSAAIAQHRRDAANSSRLPPASPPPGTRPTASRRRQGPQS